MMKYLFFVLFLVSFSSFAQNRCTRMIEEISMLKPILKDLERRAFVNYDRLIKLDNAQIDSLIVQRKKLELLLEEIRLEKEQSIREIEKLRTENEELQKLMIDYQRKINQLNQLNELDKQE